MIIEGNRVMLDECFKAIPRGSMCHDCPWAEKDPSIRREAEAVLGYVKDELLHEHRCHVDRKFLCHGTLKQLEKLKL